MTKQLTSRRSGTMLMLAGALLALSVMPRAQTPAPTPSSQDRVAALKKSIQDGQVSLRKYQWIETTVISLKGEEKSRKQQTCYYGADGKMEKVPIVPAPPAPPPPPPPSGRGSRLKEKVVENKKDEMKDYMEKASALIQQYVPPTPERIQAAKDAGRVSVTAPQPGKATISIRDYVQAGDSLVFDVDSATSRLLGVTVKTYLDKPEDTVVLGVQFSTLPDGTNYASQTTLDAKAKNIRVTIQNTGHRPR